VIRSLSDAGDAMTTQPIFNPVMVGLANWQELTRLQMGWYQSALEFWKTSTPLQPFSMGDLTIYFPFGRDYHQTIEPNTNWGFIKNSQTDHPEVEQEIIRDVASYGMQLGRIFDLSVDIGDRVDGIDAETLAEVKSLKTRIDAVKMKHGLKVA